MLDKSWEYDVDPTKQPRYQLVFDWTYWDLLVSLNKWNIIQFNNKTTSSEDFDAVHKLVLDGISENMASIV